MSFRKKVTGDITIYPYFKNLVNSTERPQRRVLHGCFWNDNSITNFNKFGITTALNLQLFIPLQTKTTGFEYISPEQWYKLPLEDLPRYWTIDPFQVTYGCLIVKGENSFDFNWTTTTAADRWNITQNNFQTANKAIARVVKDINLNTYGKPKMHHMEIRV